MLKKVSHIILSSLLLISSIGMVFSIHYCGTTLVSIAVDKESDSCCGDGCSNCHNETKLYQVKDDYLFSAQQFNFENWFSIDILFSQAIPFSITAIGENTNFITAYNESPPPPLIQTTLSSLQTYRL